MGPHFFHGLANAHPEIALFTNPNSKRPSFQAASTQSIKILFDFRLLPCRTQAVRQDCASPVCPRRNPALHCMPSAHLTIMIMMMMMIIIIITIIIIAIIAVITIMIHFFPCSPFLPPAFFPAILWFSDGSDLPMIICFLSRSSPSCDLLVLLERLSCMPMASLVVQLFCCLGGGACSQCCFLPWSLDSFPLRGESVVPRCPVNPLTLPQRPQRHLNRFPLSRGLFLLSPGPVALFLGPVVLFPWPFAGLVSFHVHN